MNFLKRALLSLWGHKGRSILSIVVFSIIFALAFGSMVIHSTAQHQIKTTKQLICANVTLREKIKNRIIKSMPLSVTNKFIKSKYVNDYNYDVTEEVSFKSFKFLGHQGGVVGMDGMLYGERDSRKAVAFISGGYKLIAGRPITVQDENKPNALIEEQLARKNNLKIGNKIAVGTIYAGLVSNKPEMEEQFTVVGIYEAPKVNSDVAEATIVNPSNFIFCSYTEVVKQSQYIAQGEYGVTSATYFLDDPAHVNAFKSEISQQLDMNQYELLTDQSWYSRVAGPLESIEKMTNLMNLLVTAAGALIFVLFIVLLHRGRRREYGVLLAIGEKKAKIVAQCFTETLLPVLLAFVIAAGASAAIGQMAGNWLLSSSAKTSEIQIAKQVQAELQAKGDQSGRNPRSELMERSDTMAQPVSSLDVSLQPSDYAAFAGITLLILLLSVGASSLMILKFNPAQILRKRE